MQEKKYVPSDVIGGVFYYLYLQSPQSPFFIGNLRKIHEVFFNLRKHYSVLRIFPFSTGEVSPFSRVLEDVLHRLELSRVIGMENPDFTRFMVKKNTIDCLKKVLEHFNDDEKKELEQVAKEFQKECGAP